MRIAAYAGTFPTAAPINVANIDIAIDLQRCRATFRGESIGNEPLHSDSAPYYASTSLFVPPCAQGGERKLDGRRVLKGLDRVVGIFGHTPIFNLYGDAASVRCAIRPHRRGLTAAAAFS
jgi:hypothetical protein